MTSPTDSREPPLAEPGKRTSGADTGGVSATMASGVADWAQRSTERADEPAAGAATAGAGGAAAKPRAEPEGKTAAGTASRAKDDDEDEWRHPPVAPVDERNPLRSLGEAIADTITNSDAGTPRPPPRR